MADYLLSEHAGKDKALWSGVAAAQTEWIGIMDGDGQYDPQDVSTLWTCAGKTGADAVWGIRTRRSDTVHRKVISRIGRAVKRLLLGKTVYGMWNRIVPGIGSLIQARNIRRHVKRY